MIYALNHAQDAAEVVLFVADQAYGRISGDHQLGLLDSWKKAAQRRWRGGALITGRELIAAGYLPGERFKEMLRAVEDAQLEGTIASEKEAMRVVRERFPVV